MESKATTLATHETHESVWVASACAAASAAFANEIGKMKTSQELSEDHKAATQAVNNALVAIMAAKAIVYAAWDAYKDADAYIESAADATLSALDAANDAYSAYKTACDDYEAAITAYEAACDAGKS